MFTRGHQEKARNKDQREGESGSLLQLWRNDSSHADWIPQAIQELRDAEGAERIGVWLEECQAHDGMDGGPVVFRGEVWEQGIGNGPPGWTRLSDDAPLPLELLNEGKSCEYDLDGPNSGPIFGPLLDLGRVLWVPVTGQRILRGLVMLGTRRKQAALPRAPAERVARTLGFLLELEETRRLAAARKADLELGRRVQSLMWEGQNANMILGQLAESCTRGTSLGGVGAAFALIGERKTGLPVSAPASAAAEEQLVIRAQSGDTNWAHGVNQGPLEMFWRQAVQERRMIGAEPDRLPQVKVISRVVAIPLQHGGEINGVLLAGLPRRKATLEGLERLELRARLAAEVLEQERRAEASSQQEYWYQALLESSDRPVILVNREGFVRGMSRGARDLLRRERAAEEANTGKLRFAELFRPYQWERVQEWFESARQREARESEPTLESELSGGLGVALTHLLLSRQEFSAIGIEKIRTEKYPRKIEEVEEALRQAIEWLEEGVVLFDENGEILTHNPRFLQILGFSAKEGRTMRNLEEVIQAVAGNFTAPEAFAAEWRALSQNATARTQEELAMEKPVPQMIERCTRTIVAPGGKKLGRVEVYRENTARRIFQSRMLQAEKLASLGQRATGIMHELSNPLTTILGNAQRIVLRAEPGAHSSEAHRILEEAERATAILRQLLHLSRQTRPERRLISLNELVERAVELQRATLAGSPLHIRVDSAERLPRVQGDAGQLQQVLLNLLQNAQQAIEQSGQGSTIGVRTSSLVPGWVRLEVWDDGPGIPEALHARIFDPFFTTKPEGMGTGLGLAIVSGFVRQHGGSISVHCPPEGGSRFVVELPAAEEAGETESRPIAKTEPPKEIVSTPAPRNGSGVVTGSKWVPHVLVVEDEATVANLIADVLRDEGMKVDVLPEGQSALEAAQRASYDLAICDLKMPGMDGQDFYRKLLQEQNPLRERILFVTGDVVAQRTHEFLERNGLPHVAKPFRVEELCGAVRRMLWGRIQEAVSG